MGADRTGLAVWEYKIYELPYELERCETDSMQAPLKGSRALPRYGQRAPSEIIPRAARIAKPNPKPAYREVTSRSIFSLPTELPMSL
jgi:hypothetical protein